MAEVALVWYSMSDAAMTASRPTVRRWSEELGLPTGVMSRMSSLKAFHAAVAVSREYERGGSRWLARTQPMNKSEEFETHHLMLVPAEGGKSIRAAEVKLFTARRTARGLVPDSHRLKTLIRPSLGEADRAVAEAWLEQFLEVYEQEQGQAPALAVRHIVRLGLLERAIPVGKHKLGMYFLYTEHLDLARRAREFLLRCAPGSMLVILPIEAGPEQHKLFAQAADEHMTARVQALLDHVDGWVARHIRATARTVFMQWRDELGACRAAIAEHERRLGHPLTRARASVELASRVLEELGPNNLHTVTAG